MSNPDPIEMNKLLIYALMARSKIVANMYERNTSGAEDPLQEKREFIEKCNAKKELAYFIKGHVQERTKELNEKEGSILQREGYISEFSHKLSLLGITWDPAVNDWRNDQNVRDEIGLLKSRFDSYKLQELERLGEGILDFVAEIKTDREKSKLSK
jgi:hypothetical protein